MMKNKRKSIGPAGKADRAVTVDRVAELMQFLIDTLPHKSRQNIKSLLSYKQVWINGKPVSQFNYQLQPGDELTIRSSREPVQETFQHFAVVFEDEHLIVVNKHTGILSVGTNDEKEKTVYSFLSAHVKKSNPKNKIFVVHRLDRETSGLMMYAKSEKVQRLLQDNWRDAITTRLYVAVAEGKFEKPEGVITSYLRENSTSMKMHSSSDPSDGKKAVTNYKVLKSNGQFTLLEVHLDTGRKNQIRVHLQEIGHPIVHDTKYGSKTNPIHRLGLHSRVLAFIHPIMKKPMRFTTAVPPKFAHLFDENPKKHN